MISLQSKSQNKPQIKKKKVLFLEGLKLQHFWNFCIQASVMHNVLSKDFR